MNQHDPDSEQALRAIDRFYAMQVSICIAALGRMRSAELADKNIILRAIMCDMPDCGICADPTAEDYGVDFWVDRAEYVDDLSFNLYVTQASDAFGNLSYLFVHSVILLVPAKNTKDSDTEKQKSRKKVSERTISLERMKAIA